MVSDWLRSVKVNDTVYQILVGKCIFRKPAANKQKCTK